MPYKLKLQKPDGKIKEVTWDKERDPTDEELEMLSNLPEPKKGMLDTITSSTPWKIASEPSTDIASRTLKKYVGNPLLEHSEGKDTSSLGRTASRYAGAFADTFGEGLDTLTSPISAGLMALSGGASMLGKLAPASKVIPLARTVNRVAGATQAAVASENLYRTKDPKQIIPLVLGLLGSRAHVEEPINPKIVEPIKPIAPAQIVREVGTVHGPPEINTVESMRSSIRPNIDYSTSQRINPPEIQQSLGLEFDPLNTQTDLSQKMVSAGMNSGSNAAEAFEGLVPERYKTTPPQFPDVNTGTQPELFGPPSTMQPRIIPQDRPQWATYAQQRNLPLEYDTLAAMESTPIPEVQKAVKQVVEMKAAEPPSITFDRRSGYKDSRAKQGTTARVAADWTKSNMTVLIQDSLAGRGIANSIDKYRTEVGRTSGQISAALKDAINPLDKTQYAEFQRLLDTGGDLKGPRDITTVENLDVFPSGYSKRPKNPLTPENSGVTAKQRLADMKDANLPEVPDPNSFELPAEFGQAGERQSVNIPSVDPMVQNALDVARTIDKDFTARATASGLHLKMADGTIVPFTGKENYWPRMYDSSMFKDKPAMIERLIKQGLSPQNAKAAVDNSRRFGERLIDPQNQRILDLPEHRKDLGALLKHYDDMAHRVVAAEEFGVKDIADPATPISQLVSQTKDPTRVTKILTQFLDRDTGVAPHEADFTKSVSKLTTAYYLSRFALSNTNQAAFIPAVTNFTSTAKAIGSFLKSPKNAWREAEATGALQTVMQEGIRELGGDSIWSKAYGIKASEGSNRTIAALAGKHYSNDLFKLAQKGNASAIKSLENLTLDSWENMKGQDSLTEKQQAYAATRTAELTQGRAQSIDLPYMWNSHPFVGLLLLYKKYAFVQNKLIKEALKTDPSKPLSLTNINPKNAMIMAALFQAGGEVTGDAKALMKSIVTGQPEKEVENRGQYIGTDSKIFNRVIQNYTDSMFFGLIGSVAEAGLGGNKARIGNFLMGPVAGGVADLYANVASDIPNMNKIIEHPSKSNTLRGIASHIPYIGSGVNQSMRDQKKF